jgi:molybdopterin molybdotransferase
MSTTPRLPVEEAINRIMASLPRPVPESVALHEALGRVMQEPVIARYTHPAWRNSAMDGYAVHGDDIRGASLASPVVLTIGGTIAAGDCAPVSVDRQTAYRIMTGAPVPDNVDTVIRVEDTDAGLERVTIRNDRDVQRNVRPRGEDFRKGDPLLTSGMLVGAAQIGIAAANGWRTLTVGRPPRVAILSSGNELVDLDQFDEVMAGRRIVNTNGYVLAAAVREAGGEPVELGIAPDDPASIAERITTAPPFDVLITCGGISVGAFDYTRDVVQRLGASLDFWRVRMRPGGPFGFGMLQDRPWFGLPGNPVSSAVTFEIFVRPALRQMSGQANLYRTTAEVTLADPVTTPGGLTHFLRCVVDNERVATLTGPQGSGLLSSMLHANALLIVPHDVGSFPAGAKARALLLQPGYPQTAVPWTF